MAATLIGCSAPAGEIPPAEPLPALNVWDYLVTIRTGVGYRDNVLLSHSEPVGSSFFAGGAEVFVSRIALDGPQFFFYASGDVNQFFDTQAITNEALAFARAEVKQDLGSRFEASLAGEYLFQDQVLDLSITETNRTALLVMGHTVAARPALRRDFSDRFYAGIEGLASWQVYQTDLDDFREIGVKPAAGWRYGHRSEVGLSYQPIWRTYENEEALDASGQPIPGETRAFVQQDVRLTWRHNFDAERHWRGMARVGFKHNEDNGGGYFDFNRYSATLQLRHQSSNWALWLEGGLAYYRYTTQTVSETDPSLRRQLNVTASINCERRLTRFLKLALSYEYQQTLSNNALETYSVNTVIGSLWWEF